MLTLYDPYSILSELNDIFSPPKIDQRINNLTDKFFYKNDRNGEIVFNLPGVDPSHVEVFYKELNNSGDMLRLIVKVYDSSEKLSVIKTYSRDLTIKDRDIDDLQINNRFGQWTIKYRETSNDVQKSSLPPPQEYKQLI